MSVEQLKFDGTEAGKSINKRLILEEFRSMVDTSSSTAQSILRGAF